MCDETAMWGLIVGVLLGLLIDIIITGLQNKR